MRSDQAIMRSTCTACTAQLEDRLVVRLLQRTTRWLRLTDDGREFLRSCRRILIALDEAERVGTPAETLRVELPTALRRLRIVPALDRLNAEYSDPRVDASFSNQLSDLFEAVLYALVRISEPRDARLIVTRFNAVAASSARRLLPCGDGRPLRPTDLSRFDRVRRVPIGSQTGATLKFALPEIGELFDVAVTDTLSINSDHVMLRDVEPGNCKVVLRGDAYFEGSSGAEERAGRSAKSKRQLLS